MHAALKEMWRSIRNIQYEEKLSQLITDKRLRKDCSSKEYQIFKLMIEDAGMAAINIDCKIFMQYSPELYLTKKDYCEKHYVEEIELMMRVLSLGNKKFWVQLKKCAYNYFGINFSNDHIESKFEY